MKKITTFSVLLLMYLLILGTTLLAQPVIVNTMTPVPVGTSEGFYKTTATVLPGAGGAGVTWDISALVPGAPLGIVNIVSPSSTPYFSTFPTSTFCGMITPTGSTSSIYSYERVSSAKWEQLANNYSGVGTGDDYTPNPESNLEFPMSYLNSFIDTFQKTGGSADPVTITYDGYGTVITPFATYTNVVRIEKYWGVGDYDYNWWETSPNLVIVASFDAQTNSYTLLGPAGTTGLKDATAPANVQLFPNPFTDHATLIADAPGGLNNASVIITDVMGKVIRNIPITSSETIIRRDGLNPGMYFYQVINDGLRIANDKFIIQ